MIKSTANLNIYIASRWQSQVRLRIIREQLKDLNITVTSSWIDAVRPEDPTPEFFRQNGRLRALKDENDIDAAEWLILDLLEGRGRRGGLMYEAGYARARGRCVIVIGNADCVFTQLFENFPTWDAFIADLKLRMKCK